MLLSALVVANLDYISLPFWRQYENFIFGFCTFYAYFLVCSIIFFASF